MRWIRPAHLVAAVASFAIAGPIGLIAGIASLGVMVRGPGPGQRWVAAAAVALMSVAAVATVLVAPPEFAGTFTSDRPVAAYASQYAAVAAVVLLAEAVTRTPPANEQPDSEETVHG